jgi:hypothetical protein
MTGLQPYDLPDELRRLRGGSHPGANADAVRAGHGRRDRAHLRAYPRIPALYTIYALVGLLIFGLYTVVAFNRLRRAGTDEAIPLAAGIFLDILNIFLLFLRLFARSS